MIKKKDLKIVADRCKGLRSDGIFMVYNGMIISAVIYSDKETPGIHTIEFKEPYNEIIGKLGLLVDGVLLSRVISGTKLQIEETENSLKLNSSKGDWQTGIFNNSYIEESIIDKYELYSRLSERSLEYSSKIYCDKELEELFDNGKFLLNLGDHFNIPLLKVTNKMIKNFKKETEYVSINISDDYILEDNIKMNKIVTEDPYSITTSYYTFIS